MHEDEAAPDAARAGAAFAARRKELGLSQRDLGKLNVITQPSLIHFELGRSWPREKTRAKLERVVQWPAGTLAKLARGGAIPISVPQETLAAPAEPSVRTSDAADGGVPTTEGQAASASMIETALEVALNALGVAVDALPERTDVQFGPRALPVLADLRQLEATLAAAVRASGSAPPLLRALTSVRRRYDELMAAAADAPGATIGQRLYAARRQANLTVAEAAAALGASPELVVAVENDHNPPDALASRIEALIAGLVGG